MRRHTQRDWLLMGLQVLVSAGSGSLTIEHLCQQLAVTKGSFYHHFADVHAYKTHLLRFAEAESTLAIIAQVEGEATSRQKLEHLLGMTLYPVAPVEVAFRAWALQDPEARVVQQRIDTQRLAYLDVLCRDLVPDLDRSHLLVQMLYTLYIGSHYYLPPLTGASLHAMYHACLLAFGIP